MRSGRLSCIRLVLVPDSNQETNGLPPGMQATVTTGQTGVDRRVQGGKVVAGEEGQAGHGQVLVRFSQGEADRPLGQAFGAGHGS
jgi:hypothetical protein